MFKGCVPINNLLMIVDTFFCPLFMVMIVCIFPVFLCIQRRHFELVKEAFPIILNVLKGVSLESEDEDKDSLRELVSRAIDIAASVQTVIEKLVCVMLL